MKGEFQCKTRFGAGDGRLIMAARWWTFLLLQTFVLRFLLQMAGLVHEFSSESVGSMSIRLGVFAFLHEPMFF